MHAQTITLLLVEDNPGDARLVREMLAEGDTKSPSNRFNLTHVERLSHALNCLSETIFDVILLDLSLPDGHGLNTVSQMRRAAPDIPIVVMSGLSDEVLAVKAVQEGAQDYLVKGHVDDYSLTRALRYAIERKRVETAEREQRELAEALRDIIAALNSTLDLEEVLNRILNNVGRVVPHDTANIMLIESGLAYVVGGRGYAEIKRPSMVGAQFQIANMPTLSQMAKTGQPVVISNTQNDPAWVVTPETDWIRSYAGTPIQMREEIVGFVNLASETVGFFTDTHAKRLQAFAEQAGVAISNASLLEAEREQRLLAETLTEVSLALTSRVSHTEVLDEILRQVQRLAPYTAANLMLVEGDTLRIARWQGYESYGGQETFANLVQPLTALPIDAEVIRSRQPVIISNTHQDPRWVVFDETAWIKSNLIVPICVRNRVLGILRLDSDTVDHFSTEDAERLQPLANAAAVALENALLFDAEARRRREAETLREATVALTSALDLKHVLDSILIQLEQVIPYKSASVLLLEEENLRVVAGRGFQNLEQVLNFSYPVEDDALFNEMRRTQWPIYLPDARTDPRYSGWDDTEVYGWMGVPLIVRRKVIGYLMLNGRQVAAYGEAEAILAQAFASQAAIAIENARLFEQTETALAQTDALYRTTRALIAPESLPDLLQIIVNNIVKNLPADRATLITFDLDAKQVTNFVTAGPGADHVVRVSYDELWNGLTGWVMRQLQPALSPKEIPDVRESPAVQQRRAETNCGAILVVPLRYRNKTLGTITVINRPDQRDFTEQDLALLVAMTNQAAVAIENVRLFEAAKQHVAELVALRQASLSLTSSLELKAVLEAILQSAIMLTSLQGARIYLYQDDQLTFGAALWVDELDHTVEEPSPNGLTYTVARQGEPMVVSDIQNHPLYADAPPDRAGSVVGLPLKIGKRVVGVMNVEHPQPRTWPEDELRMLNLLADQAAVAIENARLYEQAQQEITERKRIEAKLNAYREQLEILVLERTTELEQAMVEAAEARDKIDAILQSVADGLIVTDPDHKVILANPAAEKLLGFRLKEMLGSEVGTGIKDDRLREMVHYAFEQRSSGLEVDLETQEPGDPRKKVLRARTALVDDRQGQPLGTVTIIQDVTRLREIDRLKTDLLTTTAHELRTPLTSILGFSEILLNRDMVKNRREHYLNLIHEQSSHLAGIVAELVDIARIEAGRGIDLNLQQISIAKLMAEVVEICSEKATRHTIHLQDLSALPPILGDPFRLTQVGQNLLLNAINYSPPESAITVRGRVIPGYIEISIQDQGVGITPEQQEHLFKPFYRAHASDTGVGGTGLGLATSKLIIEQHGGEIWLESEPKVGTTVYFTLPLLPENKEAD
ncbi:MAG: GAF domain-containing protein [Anaerolineae bacterium]|nr:GAF domain-containing protein [Anaerolineae bacterium]